VSFTSVLRDRPPGEPGSPAGTASSLIDGTRVARGQLRHALLAREPGDEVEVAVLRGPRLLRRTVTLGDPRPHHVASSASTTPTDAQRDRVPSLDRPRLDEAPSTA
jgi:predicted metalloprotease with PDZ domain